MNDTPLILVVDDDPALRSLERASLEEAGFRVEEARDGHEALKAFSSLKPDLLILDVMMPGMDGFETCRRLREIPEAELTPVLMVTGLDDTESIDRAYEVGATHFIGKPFNWGLLSHYVRYLLRARDVFLSLRRSEQKHAALINALPDMMFRVTGSGIVLEFRGTPDAPFSRSMSRFIGKPLREFLPNEVAVRSLTAVEGALNTGKTQVYEYRVPTKNDDHHYEARVVTSGTDEVLVVVRDISDRKEAEEHILKLAYFDTLTGLPNRTLFKDRLNQSMQRARRDGKAVGVIFLDLDRFKNINDTLGHHAGDLLLKAVAERISGCLRSSDAIGRPGAAEPHPVLSRLGGDEFSIIVEQIDSIHDINKITMRLIEDLSHDFVVEGHEVFVTASAGVSLFPHDSEDAESLLKNADIAMYYAKEHGRNNVQFYNHAMNAKAYERLVMENSLRKALERKEFLLYYQPVVELHTGSVKSVEALIRWHHPDLGMVSPAEFIPMAEETGLIIPIGDWVLRTACTQGVEWRKLGIPPVRIGVNLSAHQLRKKDILETVQAILDETGFDPHFLELEVTESAVMQNPEAAACTLSSFKAMGIRIAIDDFGTGYSSLGYLKRFPVDVLKIDRSFVKDISTDSGDAAITMAIIAMAEQLKLKTIAEGVETKEQFVFLRNKACDGVQGYLIGPPAPTEKVVPFLKGYNVYDPS